MCDIGASAGDLHVRDQLRDAIERKLTAGAKGPQSAVEMFADSPVPEPGVAMFADSPVPEPGVAMFADSPVPEPALR
jgi:hypothetical protein